MDLITIVNTSNITNKTLLHITLFINKLNKSILTNKIIHDIYPCLYQTIHNYIKYYNIGNSVSILNDYNSLIILIDTIKSNIDLLNDYNNILLTYNVSFKYINYLHPELLNIYNIFINWFYSIDVIYFNYYDELIDIIGNVYILKNVNDILNLSIIKYFLKLRSEMKLLKTDINDINTLIYNLVIFIETIKINVFNTTITNNLILNVNNIIEKLSVINNYLNNNIISSNDKLNNYLTKYNYHNQYGKYIIVDNISIYPLKYLISYYDNNSVDGNFLILLNISLIDYYYTIKSLYDLVLNLNIIKLSDDVKQTIITIYDYFLYEYVPLNESLNINLYIYKLIDMIKNNYNYTNQINIIPYNINYNYDTNIIIKSDIIELKYIRLVDYLTGKINYVYEYNVQIVNYVNLIKNILNKTFTINGLLCVKVFNSSFSLSISITTYKDPNSLEVDIYNSFINKYNDIYIELLDLPVLINKIDISLKSLLELDKLISNKPNLTSIIDRTLYLTQNNLHIIYYYNKSSTIINTNISQCRNNITELNNYKNDINKTIINNDLFKNFTDTSDKIYKQINIINEKDDNINVYFENLNDNYPNLRLIIIRYNPINIGNGYIGNPDLVGIIENDKINQYLIIYNDLYKKFTTQKIIFQSNINNKTLIYTLININPNYDLDLEKPFILYGYEF